MGLLRKSDLGSLFNSSNFRFCSSFHSKLKSGPKSEIRTFVMNQNWVFEASSSCENELLQIIFDTKKGNFDPQKLKMIAILTTIIEFRSNPHFWDPQVMRFYMIYESYSMTHILSHILRYESYNMTMIWFPDHFIKLFVLSRKFIMRMISLKYFRWILETFAKINELRIERYCKIWKI